MQFVLLDFASKIAAVDFMHHIHNNISLYAKQHAHNAEGAFN